MNFDDYLYSSDLTDEDFCRITGRQYLEYLESLNDDDYEINRPQWLKMISVLQYFHDLAAASNGVVEACEVSPREMHGGVTAYFTVIDIKSDDIPKFCDVLMKTSAISIDSTIDGRVCISVSVPNVFTKKT